MGGIVLAFKNYKASLGIWGSEWVGFENFKRIFITPDAMAAIKNTFTVSFGRLLVEFPMGIILAIMITEMPGTRVKKIYQTVFNFPHFLSWIVVSAILTNFLSNRGGINELIAALGGERINFLADKGLFRPILYLTSNWKEMGWSAIIYMAAITGIDPTLYDAASIDGATRLRKIWHITLSGIKSTIAVMFILEVGNVMNAGFDQIFNMQNDVVKGVAQILDTYVYDITFQGIPNYGFSTAVGLFKSVINFILILVANRTVYWLTGEKMYG
ncbi:MAG: sugar ABC transporter permease [Lachnospiraceae bacterium]|nr:sugar ABC transporter permease [Lachnospiraceae bacterium]